MAEAGYLPEVIVILLVAVVVVSLFQRLGLGSVLGYLVAGAIIGPHGLALVTAVETTQHLAELGIVFLLFTVGLELPFPRIKLMWGRVFGLAAAQVTVTCLAITGIALLAGLGAKAAVIVAGGLALSSTAIVLRHLSDRGELMSQFGRSAFAVLLVQDLAVGPFLVCVLALGQSDVSLFAALGLAALKAVLAVLAIIGLGRMVLRHVFAQVALGRDPEIFAAFTLFIVLATGLTTQLAGLSTAFGAFLAGMLLAETQYRHQVAADISPFRGLLLGLFFVTVGMTIDLDLTWGHAGLIAGLAVALLLGKAVLLAALGRLFGLSGADAVQLGVLLSQAGEFAFVLLGVGLSIGAVPALEGQILVTVAAITMMVTPLLAPLGRALSTRLQRAEFARDAAPGQPPRLDQHVVIAGFGRVGSAVAADLGASNTPFIAIDMDPRRIAQARARGLAVYYGDATRPEILSAVKLEDARAMVVALDNPRAANQLVAMVHYIFPDLKIFARARDDEHARELEQAGAHHVVPELVATGQELAGSILGGDSLGPETRLARKPQASAAPVGAAKALDVKEEPN